MLKPNFKIKPGHLTIKRIARHIPKIVGPNFENKMNNQTKSVLC